MMLNNNKGLALPLVIIIIVVLMIVGMGLFTIGLSDTKHTINQEKKIQSNYLARAGVDDIAEYIMTNETIPSLGANNEVILSSGSYEITKLEANADNSVFVVESTADVDGVTSSVKLTLSIDRPSDLFDKALYTFDDLDTSKMSLIQGDIASAGSVILKESKDNFDQTQYTAESNAELNNKYTQFPISMPPDYTADYIDILTAESTITTISVDSKYDTIDVPNGTTLVFDTGSGEYDPDINNPATILEVGTKNLVSGNSGIIKVTGNGLLRLYIGVLLESKGSYNVEDGAELELYGYSGSTLDFQTPLDVAHNNPNKIRMYLDSGCELLLQANGNYYCYIHGPEATIRMQSSDTTVYGAIVGNLFKGSNVSQAMGKVIYKAPDDSWGLPDPAIEKRFYE